MTAEEQRKAQQDARKSPGPFVVWLSQFVYDAAEKAGHDMTHYRVTQPIARD